MLLNVRPQLDVTSWYTLISKNQALHVWYFMVQWYSADNLLDVVMLCIKYCVAGYFEEEIFEQVPQF